jgi:hypothetical protein
MKNRFSRKIFISVILMMVLGLMTAGCGVTTGPTVVVGPTTYTVTVMSQHPWCYGTVYLNGLPTNAYLLTWGSATIYNVSAGASIYLVDTAGLQSHTEIFNPLFGTTIVYNAWW